MTKTYRLKRDVVYTDVADVALDPALNDEQRAVVRAPMGVQLVIAGAGTGKTRALTYRVAKLLQQGVPMERIMLLTFTNRAAREMIARVEELVGYPIRTMAAGTFHRIGRRIISAHAGRLGFPEAIGILDQEDAIVLLKHGTDVLDLDARRRKLLPTPKRILWWLSKSINTGQSLETIITEEAPKYLDLVNEIFDLVVAYQSAKLERGLLDFDDLLVFWHRLLVAGDATSQAIASSYEHILVDEYQDSNHIQADIVDLMATAHGNLMVVGDDAQSIYGFRGANHANILEFPQRHARASTFYLTQNYRCSPQILDFANASIARNTRQFKKVLYSHNPPSELPAVISCRNDREEASFVAQHVMQLVEEGIPLGHIAVLYRAHAHAAVFEMELTKRGIDYTIRSGVRFFEKAHIKDVLAFLRIVLSPRDDLASMRILELCEGIGPTTARKIATLWSAYPSIAQALDSPAVQEAVPKRAATSFATLSNVLSELDHPDLRNNVAAALQLVVEGMYGTVLAEKYDRSDNRMKELETLVTLASDFDDYDALVHDTALDPDLTGRDTLARGDGDGALVLSTVHQAKGLEFDAVFILSVVEERFPAGPAMFNIDDLEEERRLFYVAATRAKRSLYLCRPMIGAVSRGAMGPLRASPFLIEIDGNDPPLFENWRLE